MSNPEVSIRFPYELDKFDPLDETLIEHLDPKWSELSEENFGENPENRDQLTKDLKEKVRNEGLEDAVRILVGDGSVDLFYLKILRAGGFTIDRSMSVLTNFLEILTSHWHYFEKSTDLPFVEKVFKQKMHTMLSHRDKFGRRVYIYRPGQTLSYYIGIITDLTYLRFETVCILRSISPLRSRLNCKE